MQILFQKAPYFARNGHIAGVAASAENGIGLPSSESSVRNALPDRYHFVGFVPFCLISKLGQVGGFIIGYKSVSTAAYNSHEYTICAVDNPPRCLLIPVAQLFLIKGAIFLRHSTGWSPGNCRQTSPLFHCTRLFVDPVHAFIHISPIVNQMVQWHPDCCVPGINHNAHIPFFSSDLRCCAILLQHQYCIWWWRVQGLIVSCSARITAAKVLRRYRRAKSRFPEMIYFYHRYRQSKGISELPQYATLTRSHEL